MAFIAFIIIFIVLLFIGMPVAFIMLLSSAVYFFIGGNMMFLWSFPERMFSGLDSFVFLALPFFMLAGEIMNRSEMSERLVEFATLVIGRVRGGLAQVNVLTSILFAGLTGIALGDVAALGKIFIPSMEKQGYTRSFAAAVTGASSIVGPIIPPSGLIVIYCAFMGVSVGGMFIAAIIPGLLIGLSDMLIVALLAKKKNFPVFKVPFSKEIYWRSFMSASIALLMPVLIIGGILSGVFTPTEAAGASVVYALFVGLTITRKLNFATIRQALKTASRDSARLFIILAAAAVVSWIFAIENVDEKLASTLLTITTNKIILILGMNLFYLMLGLWLDPGTALIIFAPVIAPFAYKLGIHPFQLGIMLIINVNIGILTPPVGFVLFAISSISKTSIGEITRDLLPFLAINILVVLLVGFIPPLTLWLPEIFGFIY
jgi:tripartite ATP-independent transporter DctM subunit